MNELIVIGVVIFLVLLATYVAFLIEAMNICEILSDIRFEIRSLRHEIEARKGGEQDA